MASIPGAWTVKYSWGCGTGYGTNTVTFAAGGTFTTSEGYNGKWVQIEGYLIFRYNVTNNTTYVGTISGNAMAGVMSTFAGLNGCWYGTKSGVAAVAAAAKSAKPDSSGARGGSKGAVKKSSKKAGGGKK